MVIETSNRERGIERKGEKDREGGRQRDRECVCVHELERDIDGDRYI
jgi:hypothetical protein